MGEARAGGQDPVDGAGGALPVFPKVLNIASFLYLPKMEKNTEEMCLEVFQSQAQGKCGHLS